MTRQRRYDEIHLTIHLKIPSSQWKRVIENPSDRRSLVYTLRCLAHTWHLVRGRERAGACGRMIFVTHPTCWHSRILFIRSRGIYFKIGMTAAWVYTRLPRRSRAAASVNPRLARTRVARGSSTRCLSRDNDRSIDPTNELATANATSREPWAVLAFTQ